MPFIFSQNEIVYFGSKYRIAFISALKKTITQYHILPLILCVYIEDFRDNSFQMFHILTLSLPFLAAKEVTLNHELLSFSQFFLSPCLGNPQGFREAEPFYHTHTHSSRVCWKWFISLAFLNNSWYTILAFLTKN